MPKLKKYIPTLPTAQEMLRYRKKHFAIKVERQRHQGPSYSDEFNLSVTHNGYQWKAIGLLPYEASEVIKELEKYLSLLEADNETS